MPSVTNRAMRSPSENSGLPVMRIGRGVHELEPHERRFLGGGRLGCGRGLAFFGQHAASVQERGNMKKEHKET